MHKYFLKTAYFRTAIFQNLLSSGLSLWFTMQAYLVKDTLRAGNGMNFTKFELGQPMRLVTFLLLIRIRHDL